MKQQLERYPKISIIIATRNRKSSLERVLQTILGDDYPNREIIVADGASIDGTVDLLQRYDDCIQWISEPDRSEAEAVNKALKRATGEIIKPMSDDDILRPGALGLAASYFLNNPEVDILFAQAARWDVRSGTVSPVQPSEHINLDGMTISNLVRRQRPTPNSITAFVRNSLYERIGNYATDLTAIDVEFWARAIKCDAMFGILDDEIVDYYLTGDNGVYTKRWALRRDLVRIAYRHGSWMDVAISSRRLVIFYTTRLFGPMCHFFGIHPLRWLAALRRK